jgi:hypothetical protein
VAAKVAIVILADTETRADRAKVANALTTAYEFKEAGEEVTVVFTGPDQMDRRALRLGSPATQGLRARER